MLTIALLVACSLASQDEPAATVDAATVDAATVDAASDDVVPVSADVSRRQAPAPGDGDVTALVAGNNSFATDLYHYVSRNNQDNLIFSPYSISLAFSMAYAGARGDTAAQMQDVLRFLPQERQHRAFNGLENHLSNLSAGNIQDEQAGPAFELQIASSLWGQQGAPFQVSYLQALASEYGAGLNAVDFSADPEAAREAINAWIAQATRRKIENMLAPGALSPQSRLVLVNAIYFYGAWLQPFQENNTEDGAFTLLNGSQVTVPLMHENTLRGPYMEGAGFRAVLLPYTGRKADMLLILPDEGNFEAIQEELSATFIQQILASVATFDVTLTLPKFDFDSELDLTQTLPQLGLTAPFQPGADFTGILQDGGLSIDAALHKATIAVDEVGTEATAATIIEMEASEMPRAEFHATRPFIMAIIERETGAILFLGHLLNPS